MTQSTTHKLICLETFGCQMNELDSQLVHDSLHAMGYRFTENWKNADIVLYNTCSVREHAEAKVYSRLGVIGKRKRENPDIILGVIGCMAERDGRDMIRRYPQVDLLCGPGELDKLPMLIDNAIKTHPNTIALQGNTSRRSGILTAAADQLENLDLSRAFNPDTDRDRRRSAYVRITRGCNKFCTYCVVPFTRGAEIHRPPDHIVEECKKLVDSGIVEITLLGQTVNHYRFEHEHTVRIDGIEQPQKGRSYLGGHERDPFAGSRVTTFANLLYRIHEEVPDLKRLRFVTSYPRDFGNDVLEVIRDCPRICRYIHVPCQTGSNRLLEMMNRGHTIEEYCDFIERIRHYLPDAVIAGDFIVGFPTETEEDFQATVEFLKWVRYKNSFIFKYSPRPGTTAIEKWPDDVPESVKKERNNILLEHQTTISTEIHAAQIGKTLEIFIEGMSTQEAKRQKRRLPALSATTSVIPTINGQSIESPMTQLSGRTSGDLIAIFDVPTNRANSLIGTIAKVRVTHNSPLALFGELSD